MLPVLPVAVLTQTDSPLDGGVWNHAFLYEDKLTDCKIIGFKAQFGVAFAFHFFTRARKIGQVDQTEHESRSRVYVRRRRIPSQFRQHRIHLLCFSG